MPSACLLCFWVAQGSHSFHEHLICRLAVTVIMMHIRPCVCVCDRVKDMVLSTSRASLYIGRIRSVWFEPFTGSSCELTHYIIHSDRQIGRFWVSSCQDCLRKHTIYTSIALWEPYFLSCTDPFHFARIMCIYRSLLIYDPGSITWASVCRYTILEPMLCFKLGSAVSDWLRHLDRTVGTPWKSQLDREAILCVAFWMYSIRCQFH